MTLEEFATGIRSAKPKMSDEDVRATFRFADVDMNQRINWDEFQRFMNMQEGPPKNDDEKMQWYWDNFVTDPKRGMTF